MNFFRDALFQMKTRICIKYFLNIVSGKKIFASKLDQAT